MTDSVTDSILPSRVDLIDGLRRFQDDFVKDFELRDLQDLWIPKKDFQRINQSKKNDEKIDLLFFYYIYIKKDVTPFLRSLEYPYQWLYERVLFSSNDKWIFDYRRAIQDIPNNQDWNVHRTDYLWDIQQKLKKLARGDYLILFGKLGFGKRWLAADACRDYTVINKMNFKIYWLNVSKCNTLEAILDKLHRLKVLMQADDLDIKYNTYSGNTKNEIIHVKNHLRKILDRPEYQNCLIVLTDVQDEKIVRSFDLNCKMLLTTRHMEKLECISKERRKVIEIDRGFTPHECNELFAKAFSEKKIDICEFLRQKSMTSFIDEVYKTCKGHPFIMSIIAKTFQNFRDNSEMRKRRCEDWIKNLDEYKIRDDFKQIKSSVEESLKFLDEHQTECYRKMVVFTDNIDIPMTVLSMLWEMDIQATEQLIIRFHKYSLIEKQKNYQICSLHYVHYKYLKEHVSESFQEFYHKQLIDKYNVERIFYNRTELELEFPDDNYFHFFIGYHLCGAKCFDLFEMYLDLGFLEEKIRISKLPNTLGDLMKFKKEIAGKNEYRLKFLEELSRFLPTVEQLLFESRDVTLLQYALTCEDLIKVEAQKQAQKFTDRVWLDDANHLQSWNQMFELQGGNKPRIVRFVPPGESLICLISLQDNNILLHDIATDYSNPPIPYENSLPHSTITDMQIFRNQAFVVLNDTGKLSVYNLKWNAARRPSAPSKSHTNESSHDRQPFVMECSNRFDDKFTCFNILELQQDSAKVDLIVGTKNGILKFYKFVAKANKFEDNKTDIKTNFPNLFKMAHIHSYVMLMNTSGEVRFINLINSATMGISVEWQKQESPVSLHQGICRHTEQPITLCISSEKVIQITHEKQQQYTAFAIIQCDDIYMASDDFDDDNKILSSTMSKDANYLILGTTKGIIVIDRFEKRVICRRNVSHQVLSLDVYRYPDEALYILISVFKDYDQTISLHAFDGKKNEKWSMSNNEMSLLVGDDLFDVKEAGDDWSIVAVDTKRNIQQRTCEDDFSVQKECIPFEFQIKKICHHDDYDLIVGCTNGSIYSINWMGDYKKFTQMTGEITYIENFEKNVIISTNNNFKFLGMEDEFVGKAVKAYPYKNDILLVVKKECAIEFVNSKTHEHLGRRMLIESNTCMAQAYCDSLLAIATAKRNIHMWKIHENFIEDETLNMQSIEGQLNSDVTCIAMSCDKNILAIGCFDGTIEIFDLTQLVPICILESHKRSIMNLQFSPWNETQGPIILLSLSESINFWNISHILNNKNLMKRNSDAEPSKTRVSQRFKSPLKVIPHEVKFEESMKSLSLKERNWSNKTGPADKRELLSCIKFIGKSAKKVVTNKEFTRFLTIDNEGNVYHLRLIDQSNVDQQVTIDFNGNPTITLD